MSEQRFALRRRVLKGAIVAFNNRHSTLPCTIRDMSETGCRLLTHASVSLPDTFELISELDGFIVACEVVRRSSTDTGVRFVGPVEYRAPRRSQVIEPTGAAGKPSLRRAPRGLAGR